MSERNEKMSKVLQHFIPKRCMAYQTLCADAYDVLWLMGVPTKSFHKVHSKTQDLMY